MRRIGPHPRGKSKSLDWSGLRDAADARDQRYQRGRPAVPRSCGRPRAVFLARGSPASRDSARRAGLRDQRRRLRRGLCLDPSPPPPRCGSLLVFSAMKVLTSLLLLLLPWTARAIEPWADAKLPVKDGLALWLDAASIPKARAALRLPPLQAQMLDLWQDGS